METSRDKNRISVVTVTWNGRDYVEEYLHSLARVNSPALDIVIVDNDSSDGTPDFVASKYPQTTLIRNAANVGFAKATNVGIRASKGRYICLINSDVVLPDGCINELVRYMDMPGNKDVGLAGPQMLTPDGTVGRSTMRFPTVRNAIGRAFAIDRLPWLSRICRSQLMSDFGHDCTCEVDVLNGWFWIVRREALSDVGLLDEAFFMYGEDLDWCFRFWHKGWRVLFFSDAKAMHYGGGSSSAAPTRFYLEMQKANLHYWLKHYSRVSYCVYYGVICIHQALRVIGHLTGSILRWNRRKVHLRKVKRSWATLAYLFDARRSVYD